MSALAIGSVNLIEVPLVCSTAIQIFPPCASIIPRDIDDVYRHSTFDDQNDIASLYDTSISKYNYLSHHFHYDDIFYK
jgi:hypothetical protein